MKKWWLLYVTDKWDKQVLMAAGVLSLIPIMFSVLRAPNAASKPDAAAAAVDTFIPKGFVLVPIEADNYESLDSILGQFGWVDLFQSSEGGGQRRIVARNVRLLRAPQNPSHFAVLIPEQDATDVLRSGGVFTVVVKPPGRNGTEIVNEPARAKRWAPRQITYGSD